MEKNSLIKKTKELFDLKKFEEIIELLADEVLEKETDKATEAELYICRGNVWYNKKEYNEAISDYNKAIEINPNYALAFYNRGFVWIFREEYDKAIEDYNKAIEIDPNDVSAYVIKGSIFRAMKEYDKAIENYNKAIEIDSNYANAYYNRGLAKKEQNVDLKGGKQDFEIYLELTANDKKDVWNKYANYYIECINEIIKYKLSVITDLVDKIKDVLLISEDCITHYTSLSVLKILILDSHKFRISEGNFLNDPSEGKEFFNFLKYEPYTSCKEDGYNSESFSSKPFIGSFVTKDKYNDLNMWRFYGKEEGVEAKGCAITLHMQKFIEDIKNSLPQGEEDFLKNESDINFYRVVYLKTGSPDFYIPNSNKSNELKELMTKLEKKVKSYKVKDKTPLEKYLNSIAFLFKSDAYQNENEVRLVIKGVEFKKEHDMNTIPPRVYIELESIKESVNKITLGPKVDKVNEWASAFYYSYKANAPEIRISLLPYK